MIVVAALLSSCGAGESALTLKRQATAAPGMLPVAPQFTSKDGVLHLKVKAEQGKSSINGRDYTNIATYDTSLVDGQGTYIPGTASAYVGPQWNVQPGDEVIVDYINALPDSEFLPVGATTVEKVPHPINLHTHGLTVSPAGNSDNVLLAVPQGRSNRYDIKIPTDHRHGLYWYHSHVHGLTDDDVYSGMAGQIVVGRADGDYQQFDGLPTVPMMIRYNVEEPNANGELVFPNPLRTTGTALAPRGKMIYTVNGISAPQVKLNSANPQTGSLPETQIWAMTNITGGADYTLALDEIDASQANDFTAVGRPLDFRVVSIDGTPLSEPMVKTGRDAERGYLLAPGARVAIQVDGASDPSKVVRLIQVENRNGSGEASAYDWAAQKYIGGYRDYSRAVLAVSTNDFSLPGQHVATPKTLTTNYDAPVINLAAEPIEQHRDFFYNDVATPTPESPNNNPIDFSLFPSNPIAQPKIGTVEEWTIYNYSSLHHPFHLHIQYGQVMSIDSPINPDFHGDPGQFPPIQYVTDMAQAGPDQSTRDIVNLPPAELGADGMPRLGPDGVPVHPGRVTIRVKIDDYLGTYVEHCHRLSHEDRGMMSMVRSIPHDPILTLAHPGEPNSTVDVVASSDHSIVASITPFDGYSGTLTTAVGDVDGDGVPDIAIGSGPGLSAAVKVYSGSSGYRDVLKSLTPFDGSKYGVNVALGDLNGDHLDDVVVGQQAGGAPRMSIYDGTADGTRLADGNVYASSFTGGVSVATGMVEAGGRVSLLTGAGAGGPPTVNVYNFDLFGDSEGNAAQVHRKLIPLRVASESVGPDGYTGGVAVATGYPLAADGGYASILVSPLAGNGQVTVFRLTEHHLDSQVDVGVSGVARPHDYQPEAHRLLTAVTTVDFSGQSAFDDGAVVATVSTPTGALLVAVPSNGGPLRTWRLDPASLVATAMPDWALTGANIGGM